MTKHKRSDMAGFVSCTCKTPYAKSTFERSNMSSNKKIGKTSRKQDTSERYPHAYTVTKGTQLHIGTYLNSCKCQLFSGKDRSKPSKRKDPSYARARKLKGVGRVLVTFD